MTQMKHTDARQDDQVSNGDPNESCLHRHAKLDSLRFLIQVFSSRAKETLIVFDHFDSP